MSGSRSKSQRGGGSSSMLVVGALLILVIGLGWSAYTVLSKGEEKSSNDQEQSNPTAGEISSDAISSAGERETDESEPPETMYMNFTDFTLALSGYFYETQDAGLRLFLLVYIDPWLTTSDRDRELTDPDIGFVGNYMSSSVDNQIEIPIGRTSSDQPIVQTMAILSADLAEQTYHKCVQTPYALDGLTAASLDCTDKPGAASTPQNLGCIVNLDDTHVLVYEQRSGDNTATGNMCQVLKNNKLTSIGLEQN